MPEIIADSIDRLTCVEMRIPGIDRGIVEPLYRAARAAQGGSPLALRAASLLRERVRADDAVLVITGAGVPPYLPYGETDGPPGAVALARAIGRGLGARTVLVTEPHYMPGLRAAAAAAGLPVLDDDLAEQRPGAVVMRTFPVDDQEGRREAEALVAHYHPAAVIAVEKLGPNAKGVIHSLRGVDGTAHTGKAHHLIQVAQAREVPTVGFGDAGNELGCGLIYDTVRRVLQYGAKCQCPCGDGMATTVKTDVLVISNTSNWGAYGTAACLALLMHDVALLPAPDEERRVIEQCAQHGAGDGMVGLPIPWVDGTSTDVQEAMLTMLRMIVTNGLRQLRRPF
ncbi:MAG TPA: glutamate cyclase domain-containing protein [bacterium]|nr:glutamate cyclase domain-containing protein [bacterium]